nr:RNA polymerase pre-readthrough protein [Johnsongrass chlorotic stripe mosaic virus]
MDTGILSRRIVTAEVDFQFGSVDYSDPRIVHALCTPGLKERATFGRQIVTALKMAVIALTLPVWWPLRLVWRVIIMGVLWVTRFFTRCTNLIKWCVKETRVTVRAYWNILNKRARGLVVLGCWASFVLYGPYALLLWLGVIVGYIICVLPSNVRYYIELGQKIQDAWDSVEADDTIEAPCNGDILEVRKGRNKFACKLAARAIGRVGLLKATPANALVYQKVILDEMKILNVRFADRVRILPLAVMASLDRPDAVARVEDCVAALTQRGVSL